MDWFNKIKETVNLSLYSSKKYVLAVLRVSYFFVVLSMIGVLIYYYGFPQTTESKHFLIRLIEFSFIFYTIRYFIRIIYEINAQNYIRKHWMESLIILYLILETISFNLYGVFNIQNLFNIEDNQKFDDFTNVFIQLFFVFYLFVDIFKKRNFRQHFKIHPAFLFLLSIFLLIITGAGLLMLPEMTQPSYQISFIDALFVATSSTSTTGLSPVDISLILTFKGQLVVLFLIQLGGLNTIAFGALYLLIAKLGIGLKQDDVIEDFVNESSFLDTEKMFTRVLKWVVGIEIVGALLIYLSLRPVGEFESGASRIFYAIFHSISSFNNAGISTAYNGLMNTYLVDNYLLHLILAILIFLGGFGMIYLFDIFGIKHLRNRMKYPWKTLRFDTKTSLLTTLTLLFIGTFVFYLLEHNRVMSGMSEIGQIMTSLFSSMTLRSAGFSTVNIADLSQPVLILMLFMMFVGTSSGSTGGGIRVSTFSVLVSTVIATIKRSPHVELFKRRIDTETVLKAYSILIFFIVGNLIGIFALLITEQASIEAGNFGLMDIIFENVSAAGTVGLTTGITPYLTMSGKIIIIATMFVGRCGTLTIAYLFGKQVISNYKYPKGHLMIG